MDPELFGCLIVFGGLTAGVVCAVVANAAYRNGVVDGYGYAREPNCPGYATAGEYLRKTMRHRWAELGEDDYD